MRILKEEKGVVSGRALSSMFRCSRTSIWKHIKALKEEGYGISSIPRFGYRLYNIPDLLLPREIKEELSTKFIGHKIYYFKETGSTNDVARDLALASEEEGTLVIAERQTKGKGRIGRRWVSPFGGIWMSLILRPRVSPADASRLTLLSSLAVCKSIKKVVGLPVFLKWPNDVLIGKKKVCGILTEMDSELDLINFVIVGIGINVNMDMNVFPEGLQKTATSIKEELGKDIKRIDLLKSLLEELERLYLLFTEGKFSWILKEWKGYDCIFGHDVEVATLGEIIKGRAMGVDEDGALIIKGLNGATKRILSGDVRLWWRQGDSNP
ncbi:MAG: biotin--[acetyl-CoA-carboxylase] ligase [bacterium]|nr:biotin--[acetyl-CoA-carboxylase] ligase [bacterium]